MCVTTENLTRQRLYSLRKKSCYRHSERSEESLLIQNKSLREILRAESALRMTVFRLFQQPVKPRPTNILVLRHRLCYLTPQNSATLHRPPKLTRMEFRFEVLKTDPTGARPGVASALGRDGRTGFRVRRFRRRADSRAAAKFAARFRAHLPSDYTACMWSRSSPRVSPSYGAAALWKRAPPRKSSARPRTPIRNP
jgi:hypothetical protein